MTKQGEPEIFASAIHTALSVGASSCCMWNPVHRSWSFTRTAALSEMGFYFMIILVEVEVAVI